MRARLLALVALLAACTPPPGPTLPTPTVDPRGATDPVNQLAVPALRAHAATILADLVRSLPADRRARVAGVMLLHDNALGEVNAYATCARDATPIVAISDGLLLIAAHLAQTTATDERFATHQKSDYLAWLHAHDRRAPPPGFYLAAYRDDHEKLLRQREVFDEQVAFIVGHELAHHYLGHLGCDGKLDPVVHVADGVPLFDQATELAADIAAVKNLLTAGHDRPGYAWTEGGALLVLAAFHHRTPRALETILTAFNRTHPLPALRMPLITTTADLWRVTGELPL